jgi:hypothetical protein
MYWPPAALLPTEHRGHCAIRPLFSRSTSGRHRLCLDVRRAALRVSFASAGDGSYAFESVIISNAECPIYCTSSE